MTEDASPGLGLPSLGGRSSLREQVADALRALLVSGRLRPGELYSAPGLAAEFGVSPTPVREAMLDLVREGLVEPVRNKGFRVTAMSDAELDALAELRGLIEVPVMTAVARDADADTWRRVEELRPLARSMVDAAAAKDLARYVALDTEFHLRFLALHGNDYVVEVVRDLRGRSRLFGLAEMAERGTLPGNAVEHEEMVDLVLARDADGMARLMRDHLGQIRQAWAGRDPSPT
ncbi:Transcriptional regulator, GntR family [Nostocoides japonicum T1-X7]|uniref:Transcriptional regulator, GntR family n=1 Tax=Nostocoides japonicum T1-X7 TaxID=1194083 RepID=A0A077LTG6_9MICO|nr:GntR family transcriptional regulator [Tetrasphaera japonica]CCH76501.1 Transcriptional regulator, GntR family [Tetrasphaera japonica T1-X7]